MPRHHLEAGFLADVIYQFRINLLLTDPQVWRRIQVRADATFWDLHVAIQDAMGWLDCHLHDFTVDEGSKGTSKIGIPDPDGELQIAPGWRRKLKRYCTFPGVRLLYEYDYGDSWLHAVLLEAIALAEPGVRYPRCVAGEWKCPPEDCGGPPGFAEFLAVIADPDHEEHDETLTWVGGSYDPADFDPTAVRFDDPRERLLDAMG